MKNIIAVLLLCTTITFLSSCEKDEGKLPAISFKTGGSYLSSDATIAGGTDLLIGIDAAKTEEKDVLKKFNISKSVDGAASTSVYDQDLSGSDGDNFSYDYTATLDTVVGQINTYTFTVTNRDGLINQVALSVVVQ